MAGISDRTEARGADVWTGPTLTFSKAAFADWTQPVNQDRLRLDVWLTRASTQGLFNAAEESGFSHFFSPADTEWAYGTLANYASLTYSDWESWNGGAPPSMVGRDAVLHLIPDDVYLSIKFTSWGGTGGAFSYQRSTEPVPEPCAGLMLLAGLGGLGVLRFRRC